MQIERGEHNYEFQFRLPANLPSSFEGDFGHIRYIATVVLDIPNWPDDEYQQPFTVIKPLDLNDDLELKVISINLVFDQKINNIFPYRIRSQLKKTTGIIHALYCVVFHRNHYH